MKLVRILTEPPMYLPPSSLMPWSNCLFWEWLLIPDIWKIYLSSAILVKNRDVNNIHHKWVIQWQFSNKITLIGFGCLQTEKKHRKKSLIYLRESYKMRTMFLYLTWNRKLWYDELQSLISLLTQQRAKCHHWPFALYLTTPSVLYI